MNAVDPPTRKPRGRPLDHASRTRLRWPQHVSDPSVRVWCDAPPAFLRIVLSSGVEPTGQEPKTHPPFLGRENAVRRTHYTRGWAAGDLPTFVRPSPAMTAAGQRHPETGIESPPLPARPTRNLQRRTDMIGIECCGWGGWPQRPGKRTLSWGGVRTSGGGPKEMRLQSCRSVVVSPTGEPVRDDSQGRWNDG